MRRKAIEERFGDSDIRQILVDALNTQGSVPAAAKYLGLGRTTFFRWKKQHNIQIRRVAVAGRKAS